MKIVLLYEIVQTQKDKHDMFSVSPVLKQHVVINQLCP